MTKQTWDQALVRRVRAGGHRRGAGGFLTALLVVGLVVGLLPGLAQAHFDAEGLGGAQLDIADTPINPHPSQNLPRPLRGRGFVANDRVFLFECPPSATPDATDPLDNCMSLGVGVTDTSGEFSTQVLVPSAVVTAKGRTVCAFEVPLGCYVAAATYDTSLEQMTSMAYHYVCFTNSSPGCTINRDGSPPTTTTTLPPTGEWEPAAPLNVPRRDLATAVGLDGRIYALGGTSAPIPAEYGTLQPALDSAEVLDPCGQKTWAPITSMPTARTQFAAATGPDGLIYAIGGRDAVEDTPLATVDAYDPSTDTWSEVARLAQPRADLAAATGPDGLIYAIGGQTGKTPRLALQTVEAYNTETNEWTQVTPSLATHVREGATLGPNGRIYALGVENRDMHPLQSPGVNESYSPGSQDMPGSWRPEPAPNVGGGNYVGHAAIITGANGLIYAIGGEDDFGGEPYRTVWAFDPDNRTWTRSSETLMTRRTRLGAAAGKDGRIYAIGGIDYVPGSSDPHPAFASTESARVAPSSCPAALPPSDFDGSRTTDYSVFRPSTGTWFVKDGLTMNYGTEGDIPVPADYDGDRKADVAVFRPSTGMWFVRQSSGGDTALAYGTSGDIPVPGDYDGDEKTDMAVFRPSNGVWFIKYSGGGDAAVAWGTSGDVAVPGDYDGDKKADVAVFRDGTWFIRPASGAADMTVNYGTSGDIPVVADYGADNTADIAVFRPSNGFWFLRHSSDGTQEAFHFGTSGDVPVPGDYNADAIADPAVFRPSSGVWFVETGAIAAWGTATDIPLPLPAAVRMAYFPATA